MPVRIQVQRLDRDLPAISRAHPDDAGLDLLSSEDVTIKPGERALISTGIAIAIPVGFAGFVQPRSGLAAKKGLGLLNSPGLIDPGYRGEVKVIAINLDMTDPVVIHRGDRIAQLVILPVPDVELVEVESLPVTDRGTSGFGSSGVS